MHLRKILPMLFFSLLIAVPLVGQQQSGTPATSPMPSSTPAVSTASSSNNAATATSPDVSTPLTEPPRQGFWGRMNPFARKKYVQTQVQPIRDRVNELDGLSQDNAKAISNLDTTSQAGIKAAQDTARQASDQAVAAQQQVAQDGTQANQLNDQVNGVGSKLNGVDSYQVSKTLALPLATATGALRVDDQQKLDVFLQGIQAQKGYVVEVTAYAAGKDATANTASQNMADAVVRYLVLQGNVPLYRIYNMGLGNATPTATDSTDATIPAAPPKGGTVRVRLLTNSLADNAASGGGGR